MSTTTVPTPTSRVRFGLARADITPPANIYHPLWGAARHHRATGIHRPLTAEVMVFGPSETVTSGQTEPQLVRVQLDLPGLVRTHHRGLIQTLSETSGLAENQIVVSYSHTHAAGWFLPDRIKFPGGELIEPYLESLGPKLAQACREAITNSREIIITYAQGRCNMAANRDYWDEARNIYACGYNPDAPADDTIVVARITDMAGEPVAVVVNYACHATTLAWKNTLISPDFVGAMRETVERATGVTCVFALGACGDLGPKEGFVGDVGVADRNGRQLGYAALSTLESMPPEPANDFHYQGPVVSGATLGTWAYAPLSPERLTDVSRFAGGVFAVDLPLKPRPDTDQIQQELEETLARVKEADARGDTTEARNQNAYAERARRWLARLNDIPEGSTMPLHYSVYRMGDAIWVTCGGEPYNAIQVELRQQFPHHTVIFSPVASELQIAYLLPEDRYGKGLYQEEPSILAPGCLETVTDTISDHIQELVT